uniref:Transposase n=1 Tax=Ascaris lumbricoides TaxID=6252 RepID=A0A0M3I4Q9_ASCLU
MLVGYCSEKRHFIRDTFFTRSDAYLRVSGVYKGAQRSTQTRDDTMPTHSTTTTARHVIHCAVHPRI